MRRLTLLLLLLPLLLLVGEAVVYEVQVGPRTYSVGEEDLPAYRALQEGVRLLRLEVGDHGAAALSALDESLALNPLLWEAWLNKGLLFASLGRSEEAIQAYESGLSVPGLPPSASSILWSNIGNLILQESGKDVAGLQRAQAALSNALQFDGDNFPALLNAGLTYDALSLYDDALDMFHRALALQQHHTVTLLSVGNLHFRERKWDLALDFYQHVALGDSDGDKNEGDALTKAAFMIGQVYRHGIGDNLRAIEAYDRALNLNASSPSFFLALQGKLQAMRAVCLWCDLQNIEAALRQFVAGRLDHTYPLQPYEALFSSELTPGEVRDIADRHVAAALQSEPMGRHPSLPSWEELKGSSSSLRVAYSSFDFRDHAMGWLTQGLICGHNSSRVHAMAVSFGPADDSSVSKRLRNCAADFLDVADDRDDLHAAESVWRRAPHILVDLMGMTTGNREVLVALKPAPIVVNYLGYPSSSGPLADYLMVDRVAIPPEASSRSVGEGALVYLPNSYQSNQFLGLKLQDCRAGSRTSPARCERLSRKSLGIDDPNAAVLCNLNAIDKLEPASLDILSAILKRVPMSILVLLEPGEMGAELGKSNIRAEAAARGVDPRRVIFRPRLRKEEHLASLSALCDLFVDSLLYGAHSTASDALWAGVPLITAAGFGPSESFAGGMPSRVAFSLLSAAGIPELATHSVKVMTNTAVRLLSQKSALLRLQSRILTSSRGAPLFDTQRQTDHVEAAYEAMAEIQAAGLPLHSIIVGRAVSHKVNRPEQANAAVAGAVAEVVCMGGSSSACQGANGLTTDYRRAVEEAEEAAFLSTASSSSVAADAWMALAAALKNASDAYPREASHWLDLAQAAQLVALESAIDLHPVRPLPSLLSALPFSELLRLLRTYGPSMDLHAEAISAALSSAAQNERYREWRSLQQYAAGDDFVTLEICVALERSGAVVEAYEAYGLFLTRQNVHDYQSIGKKVPRLPRPAGKISVALYCHEYGQAWFPNWGPSSVGKGLGGSEEAAVFITRELVKLGYWVEVYADPSSAEIGLDEAGVVWYPHTAYDSIEGAADIFISWRYMISMVLGSRSSRRFLWLQDLPSMPYPSTLSRDVDAIFCLSSFHISMLSQATQHLAVVTPNGLDPQHFVDGPNHPTVFIYSSSPTRGLDTVLKAWPRIRDRVPGAVLEVYYGFTKSVVEFGRRVTPDFDAWMAQMWELLAQDGVQYFGMVDHMQLAHAFARAGFILYPTAFPETGCVTLMKAQAMGAVPITSKYDKSTLPDLTDPWDLGPSQPLLEKDLVAAKPSAAWVDTWVEAVVTAATRDAQERQQGMGASEGTVQRWRMDMIAAARARFPWSSVAKLWQSYFERDY
jgi:protein O-GlcNAc transferase